MINNLLKKDMLPPDRLKFVLNTRYSIRTCVIFETRGKDRDMTEWQSRPYNLETCQD